MKTFAAMGILGIHLSLVVSPASACGLVEVAMGDCASENLPSLPPSESDRSAFNDTYIWTRYPGAVPYPTDITLKVCFYRREVNSAGQGRELELQYLNDSSWQKATQQAIEASERWTSVQEVLNGVRMRSRLLLDFGTSNEVRDCDQEDAEIRIFLNSSDVYSSTVGFMATDNDGWTMTLGANSNGEIQIGRATHEFGHTFGFIHEMNHFAWKDCLQYIDYPAMQFSGMFGYNEDGSPRTEEEEISILKQNMDEAVEDYGIIGTTRQPDPSSVMAYPVYSWQLDGHPECVLAPESSPSERDRFTYLSIYGVPAD